MARRKPARVQQHAQRLKRSREQQQQQQHLLEGVGGSGDGVSTSNGGQKKRRRGQKKSLASQRSEPLLLSWRPDSGNAARSTDESLWFSFPVPTASAGKLGAALSRLQLGPNGHSGSIRIELTLLPTDRVTLRVHGATSDQQAEGEAETALQFADLFPAAYAAFPPHVATLAELQLLSMDLQARRESPLSSEWRFYWSAGIDWRRYMALCHARGLAPVAALPLARPVRPMHHVMIWLLKYSHDAQLNALKGSTCPSFRYWNEVEVLFDRFVGPNAAACVRFEAQTFAMPEIYGRIDAKRQLEREIGDFQAPTELRPTLRAYQKAAVAWMLAREQLRQDKADGYALSTCVSFGDGNSSLRAYDVFCAAFHAKEPSSDDSELRSTTLALSQVRGGVLADEMGLGKTVEVIALVLGHRRSASRPTLLSTLANPAETRRRGQQEEAQDPDVVACICGSSEEHALGFVQCESCGTWHHQLCTGFVVDESTATADFNDSCPSQRSRSQSSASTSSSGLWDFDTTPQSGWNANVFVCFQCQSLERPRFASATTLIVSPEPIHAQWEHELSRHVRAGALSVVRYPGVRALRARLGAAAGPSAEWQVLASPGLFLARYDVVLTTYEALGADVHHVPTAQGGARRASTRGRRKRYAFVGSPLVALHFWRVCMDEAQVGVENTRLQAALAVAKLSAEHRWVVTGTPFSSRVGELFGYLRFLRVPPYATAASLEDDGGHHGDDDDEALDLSFFREAVERTFERGAIERVLDLLLWDGRSPASSAKVDGGGLLWRSGKRDVLAQLALPPQSREVVWCRFSAVERHFYDQQQKRIVALVRQRQREKQQGEGDGVLATGDLIARDDRLWQDLLVLRQLCCHPQVGGARHVWGSSGVPPAGGVLTMDAFLHELLAKATRECEEAQRQLVGAQNGLAALLVLQRDVSGAALTYLAVMRLVRDNWPLFRADLLPRLHILQNLERCVHRVFELPSSDTSSASDDDKDAHVAAVDPRQRCLLPEVPTLERCVSAAGLQRTEAGAASREEIRKERALLAASARRIRQFYLLQVESSHAQALRGFQELSQSLDEAQEPRQRRSGAQHTATMLCTAGCWWSDALAAVEQSERDAEQQLVARVQARLAGFETRWAASFCSQLVSARSLRLLLVRELETLAMRRHVLWQRLAALSRDKPSRDDVERSGNCARCRDGGSGPTCEHCALYKELEGYRAHLLGLDGAAAASGKLDGLLAAESEDEDADKTTRLGSTAGGSGSSLLVEVFKEVAAGARSVWRGRADGRALAHELQTRLQHESEFWSKLQREWRAAKRLFHAQHQRLGALDELAMACSQLRLREPGESTPATKAERLYKLEAVEVPVREAELTAERVAADAELRDKLAQLRYLLQLRREAETRPGSQQSDREPRRGCCAVCLQDMAPTRAVLACAHAFCQSCVATLSRGQRKTVRCPTCRRLWPVSSVAVVVAGSDASSSVHTQDVASPPRATRAGGGFGSKLDALLARVEALRQREPRVKCLLFSQWPQLLALATQALPRLGVRCFAYSSKKLLPQVLAQFQACRAACVLALPFKVGANGLNIVEATEVLLLEPLLSASMEAQAVNRVHRLGQTRQTRVHRLIVQDSVEERIYRLGYGQESMEETAVVEDEDVALELGVALGRKAKETLTMRELTGLLHGEPEVKQESDQTESFWGELVLLDGDQMARTAVCGVLERRDAAERRMERSAGRHDEEEGLQPPQTTLFGRRVVVHVAQELLALPSAAQDDDGDDRRVGVDQRELQRQRRRVEQEIALWRAQAS